MVESSGSSCRCACQDELRNPQEQPSSGCCSPHVFTSILLGILSCVLMTGGVFLAFHRWDPMWLMVSGVGVVLIIIGTILHCCNNLSQRPKRHSTSGKGCCARPVPPDHNGHLIANNGSLTEQLLPLSNARSVSQLSLNMLPGYFPPVVTAYGIEQHSAVVQNINRIVQQQQQPQSPGSMSPGVISNAGKSFIVLSLPSDATAANIQNLVATVYQLDGNTAESTANEVVPNITAPIVTVKPNSTVPLILKSVEVQTCNVWPTPTTAASTSGINPSASLSFPTDENSLQTTSPPTVPSATCGDTQTDDIIPIAESTNLIDCSTDIASSICDIPSNMCDNQPLQNNSSALVNIPSASTSTDLLNVTLTISSATESSTSVLVDIPEQQPSENIASTSVNQVMDVVEVSSPPDIALNAHSEVLVDISTQDDVANANDISPLLNNLVSNSNCQQVETIPEGMCAAITSSSPQEGLLVLPQNVPGTSNSNLQNLNPELMLSTSNLSTVESDIDDGELMERSSPPPSYDDVTLEGESVTAFGLAYGTI